MPEIVVVVEVPEVALLVLVPGQGRAEVARLVSVAVEEEGHHGQADGEKEEGGFKPAQPGTTASGFAASFTI